jgi:hypothetical protein
MAWDWMGDETWDIGGGVWPLEAGSGLDFVLS